MGNVNSCCIVTLYHVVISSHCIRLSNISERFVEQTSLISPTHKRNRIYIIAAPNSTAANNTTGAANFDAALAFVVVAAGAGDVPVAVDAPVFART